MDSKLSPTKFLAIRSPSARRANSRPCGIVKNNVSLEGTLKKRTGVLSMALEGREPPSSEALIEDKILREVQNMIEEIDDDR